MKKTVSALVGIGMIAGTVALATPASANQFRPVTCADLQDYKVKDLKKKYRKKKRQCLREAAESKRAYDAQQNAKKNAIPPTVSNLVVVPRTKEEQDYRYDEETSYYAISFQIPEAAKGKGIDEFVLTLGDKTETMYVYGGDCENDVCTYTKDYLEAPWGSTAVVGVTSVSFYGQMSEMVVASAVMPVRPNQNKTYTFVANGDSTAVPTQSGGDSWVDGNQSVTYTFDRRTSLPSYKYSVYASNYYGPASCQIYRDGVLIDEEYSNGGTAFCSV